MKLHELKPAPGSRKDRTRVGRGIAAGKGKTAGRGTKGQRSRAGASIPAWFEGGQTPLHIRIPKLRGFRRFGRIEFQVVNVGRISAYAASGRFGVGSPGGDDAGAGRAGDPVTVNAEMLRSAGLVGSDRRPVKVLGAGDVSRALFVAADAFTRSAREKIEAAGGFVQVLAPDDAAVEPPVDGTPADGTPADGTLADGTPADGTRTDVTSDDAADELAPDVPPARRSRRAAPPASDPEGG